ncbi:MAG: type II toxin-antitoxin system VapC family toxin [Deltaproteobacteria bacterium]|nr:MAG: type II toxin-antitoxin system VapC family toxin [Deltaproteobacteria bacterium]
MYLFDTDCLSNILKKAPSPLLIKKLESLPKGLQFTTSINVSEIYFGTYRSRNREKILKAYEDKVFPNVNILPFDTDSGKIYGRLKALLEKRGLSKSEPDLMIAAIAIQHNMILVTENKRHFMNIPGLNFEDWINDD